MRSDAGVQDIGDEALLTEARRVLQAEAASVSALEGRLDRSFVDAARLLAGTRGRIVVSGVGKSGHIARKIAGTLTSTGTSASFLHPVEALHGDLGIIGADDVALLVTKSARGAEVEGLLLHLARLGVPVIALTGTPDAKLGDPVRIVLDASVHEEACPWDLAPTTSTTAALALGDALAMVVLQLRGFAAEDFAALHPGGTLGQKLSIRVANVMVTDEVPTLSVAATMRDAISPLAEQRGTVAITDDDGGLIGVITAGDLTRLMERDDTFLDRCVDEVMTQNPRTATTSELGVVAARRMQEFGVMALPVLDEAGSLVGMVHLHDLMRTGAI